MARMAELRKQAKDLGIAPAVIRAATTAEELQEVIEDHESHESKPRAKKKARPVRKAARKATVAKAKKTTTAKRNSGRKASAPARSRKSGTAKRQSKSNGNSRYVPKGGRNVLDHIDYGAEGDWNPRDGSPPDRIIKALKRFRGNREKVFDHLLPDIWDFMGRKKRNGERRTKAEAEAMLKYRIARTAWDFAMRTGQHEAADNRVEYGTGGTGEGVWKPAKRKATGARKSAPAGRKATQAKRKTAGRKKTAQSRTGAKRRGRPKAGARR